MIRKDTRFVEYKHLKSGKVDNMPERLWKDHIAKHRTRKYEFEFLRVIDVTSSSPDGHSSTKVEILEDELECPLCGHVAHDEEDLKKHKDKKHA